MSLQPFGPFWAPALPAAQAAAAPAFSSPITIDVNVEAAGFVFRIPKTGTLDMVEFRFNNMSNVPDNGVKVSFQDLSAGEPDGGADQYRVIPSGSLAAGWATPGLMTSDGTDTGTKRSVTVGDYLAVVIENNSFTAGDSFQVSALNMSSVAQQLTRAQHYCTSRNSGGTWTDNALVPCMALKYSDGTYAFVAPMWYPISALTTATFNNGSSPDERGLVFSVPVSMELTGAWMLGGVGAAGDLVLYDSGGNAIATVSFQTQNSGQGYLIPLPPTTLVANSTYRLVLKPTSGSNVTLYDFTVPGNSYLAAVEGGINWYYTQRTDAGAWTDTNTRRPWMGLQFDAIAVGGILEPNDMTGGLI